jgi:hypothetical protein
MTQTEVLLLKRPIKAAFVSQKHEKILKGNSQLSKTCENVKNATSKKTQKNKKNNYRIFRHTKRTGVKPAPPIFRSIHRQNP